MPNYIIGISMLDADGDTSSVQFYATRADDAAALALAQGLASAIDDISGSQIVNLGITSDAALPGGLKGAPVANSDNEVKGRFIFAAANPNFKARVSIPGFLKDTLTVVGGDIDTADPLIFAFADTAVIGGGVTTSHYEDLTTLVKAYEAFGNR